MGLMGYRALAHELFQRIDVDNSGSITCASMHMYAYVGGGVCILQGIDVDNSGSITCATMHMSMCLYLRASYHTGTAKSSSRWSTYLLTCSLTHSQVPRSHQAGGRQDVELRRQDVGTLPFDDSGLRRPRAPSCISADG